MLFLFACFLVVVETFTNKYDAFLLDELLLAFLSICNIQYFSVLTGQRCCIRAQQPAAGGEDDRL